MSFQRSIKTPALMCTAIGGMVGSGWLFGPFISAQIAGPGAILSWLIGGILMMFIAFTFAELSAAIPVAGGMARFAQFSHGTLVSFTIAWVTYLAAVIVAPIESMAAIEYATNYFPQLAHHSTAGDTTLTPIGILAAAVLMLILCYLNVLGARFFAKSNTWVVIWKLIIPIVTVIILFSYQHNWDNFTEFGGFAPYGIKGILTALPAAGVIFSFIGYGPAIQLAQEAKNPKIAIPIAVIGALTICILLYITLEIAFIGAIDPSRLGNGWHNLHFTGDFGPIAGLLTGLGLVWFVKIIYLDAIISPCGTAYIYTAATSRINYAMSKNGYFPEVMLKLNQKGVPYLAILVNFVVGLIFFMPFPGWQKMVEFLVTCFIISYTVGPIACLALRKHQPDLPRSFKVPCAPIFCSIAFIICNLIIYWAGWGIMWRMLLTILMGYVFLGVYRTISHKEHLPLHFKSFWWMIPYFTGLGIISYLGDFGGGKNIIPFGVDILIISIFSVIILLLAHLSSFKNDTINQAYKELAKQLD